ncbi:MAG: AAA family ATPase [Smithella sp.]|jgi:putative ATP-dependent endonuclease of OLD family
MYISQVEIENYRCFGAKQKIKLKPSVNVFIGENNSGKTTILNALGFIFDKRGRSSLGIDDFNKNLELSTQSPKITVTVILSSTGKDTIEDKALVATWLTSIGKDWEAKLTYSYHLPEEDEENFKIEIEKNKESKEHFWKTLEIFQPKYVSRIYCGNEQDRRRPEPDALDKFEMRFLKAIRDVESEMFSGSQPVLRKMLQQVLDNSKTKDEKKTLSESFQTDAAKLLDMIKNRLDTKTLFALVDDVGASEGGSPTVEGKLTETDLLKALNLAIPRHDASIPLTQNGLGYNNLIYIALLLRSMEHSASEKQGQNAVAYSMLAVEEPEAHLHPALQYKLLKYFIKQDPSRQIFMTTHSTHITAGAGLDPIISLSTNSSGEVVVVYPSECFQKNESGLSSRKYVERYLDATKSNMLFCKGVLFAEGIAEQLLIPTLAEYISGCDLEKQHVTIINVGGSTFKHFLPLFGAGTQTGVPHLQCRVGCIPDGDPKRKHKEQDKAKYKKCYPYQIDLDAAQYEYQPISSVVTNLEQEIKGIANIQITHSVVTLEYDLAYENENNTILITDSCSNKAKIEEFMQNKDINGNAAKKLLDDDTIEDLKKLKEDIQPKAAFASVYIESLENSKGEHALDLANALRKNAEKTGDEKKAFVIPEYIRKAIQWVCGKEQK